MKTGQIIRSATLAISATIVFGCGSGGSGVSQGTTVSGVAQAGLIRNGTAKVFAVYSGSTFGTYSSAPTLTGDDGRYNVTLPPGILKGAVWVKVFGSYQDEATGETVTIPPTQPLQAAIPVTQATGSVTIPVTPLTDIAVRKAQNSEGGIAANIAAANQAVSQVFGVDITRTEPVPPTTAALTGGATDEQKKYTTVLTMLSQYVATAANSATPTGENLQATMQTAMGRISDAITTSGSIAHIAAPDVAVAIQNATTAIATNENTRELVTAAGNAATTVISSLSSAGATSGNRIKSYKIKTTGSYSGLLYGLQVSIGLPSGVTVRTSGSDGETQSGVLAASGAGSGGTISARAAGGILTVGAVKSEGMAIGEFASLYVDIPADATAPAAGAFVPITGITASDGNGNMVGGIGVTIE